MIAISSYASLRGLVELFLTFIHVLKLFLFPMSLIFVLFILILFRAAIGFLLSCIDP